MVILEVHNLEIENVEIIDPVGAKLVAGVTTEIEGLGAVKVWTVVDMVTELGFDRTMSGHTIVRIL